MNYQRHTLCYLTPDAKPLVGEGELFTYWLSQNFPLIYTHQPQHLNENQMKLAIPYFEPGTQQKIRLSYLFSPASISHSTTLPQLKELFPDLVLESNSLMRVYGSYCWQYITHHPYVHPSSDLDIQITHVCESLSELAQLYTTLNNVLPIKKLDGEVRFPNLGDCSWLELIQEPPNEHLLFKSEHLIRLISRKELYATIPSLLA